MKVKIKKLDKDAVIPKYAKPGDAGMDLVCVSKTFDHLGNVIYGTGLAFEIPKNHFGLLCPRSSLSKYKLSLSNNLGICDSEFRGEVLFKYRRTYDNKFSSNDNDSEYSIGDRVGQIIILPYPEIEFEEVNELNETERGAGGWGHSGT